MVAPTPKIKIAISGGGISGLALATGLHNKHPHLDFHVYEATAEYKDIGGGLAIHQNGITAMKMIAPSLAQAYFDKGQLMGEADQELSTEVIIAQGPFSGETLARLGTSKGRKTVSRADLLEGFCELVPKERISFGKRVQRIEQDDEGVTLSFTDGSTAHADILISADGVHSPGRPHIIGPDHPNANPVNHDRWLMVRNKMPMDTAIAAGLDEKFRKLVPIMPGPRGYMHSMPVNKGTTLSVVVAKKIPSDGSSEEDAAYTDEAQWEDYSEDARKIGELVNREPQPWQVYDHDTAPIYFRGRVVMIGDAAHTTMAFNGQGAAQSLEDAAVLDHLFTRFTSLSQVDALFAAYDATRRPRSQRVVEISRQFGRIYSFEEGDLHKDIGEMRRVMGEGGKYTNAFDLDKQNEDAMALFEKALGVPNGDKADV